jgi:hypothetical protein
MFARLKSTRNTNFVLEILMIVVGINVALWFEGWFEDLKDAETEREYLAGLRDDLRADVELLDQLIANNRIKIDNLTKIVPDLTGLAGEPPETQANAIFEPSNYLFFQPADFTYRSMQESGDFRLLSDAGIKKGILRLIRKYREIEELQKNFLQAMDDVYIPIMMQKFDLMEGRIADVSLVEDQAFLNFFLYTLQETDGRNDAYVQARAQAQDLLGAIVLQLGKETT